MGMVLNRLQYRCAIPHSKPRGSSIMPVMSELNPQVRRRQHPRAPACQSPRTLCHARLSQVWCLGGRSRGLFVGLRDRLAKICTSPRRRL